MLLSPKGNPNDKLGAEGSRDGVGIYRGLGTGKDSKSGKYRQDCTAEKGNDRGFRRLQQPERLLGAAGTKDQIFTGSHLRAD